MKTKLLLLYWNLTSIGFGIFLLLHFVQFYNGGRLNIGEPNEVILTIEIIQLVVSLVIGAYFTIKTILTLP
jgi:hypothetical protein